MKEEFDNKKFGLKEMFNNSQGQTAVAFIIAFFICATGCLCFVYGMLRKPDILIYVIQFTGLGTAILLGRNIKDSFVKSDGE